MASNTEPMEVMMNALRTHMAELKEQRTNKSSDHSWSRAINYRGDPTSPVPIRIEELEQQPLLKTGSMFLTCHFDLIGMNQAQAVAML